MTHICSSELHLTEYKASLRFVKANKWLPKAVVSPSRSRGSNFKLIKQVRVKRADVHVVSFYFSSISILRLSLASETTRRGSKWTKPNQRGNLSSTFHEKNRVIVRRQQIKKTKLKIFQPSTYLNHSPDSGQEWYITTFRRWELSANSNFLSFPVIRNYHWWCIVSLC